MLPFTRTDIERLFPAMTWERAEKLFDARSVVEIDVERDGRSITGQVRGERRVPFLTRINVANGRGGRVRLSSTCTCPIYSECEHAAATLLGVLDKSAAPIPKRRTSPSTPKSKAGSTRQFGRPGLLDGRAGDGADCILYLLEPTQRSVARFAGRPTDRHQRIAARRVRGGVYGREHPLALSYLPSTTRRASSR